MSIRRQTKIVATIGPASSTKGVLRRLVKAGVNVARVNLSHGTWRTHSAVIKRLREVSAELDSPLAIMADLQGPKIRTGTLARGKPVTLDSGDLISITTRDVTGSAEEISTTYDGFPGDVRPGQRVYIDDGRIELVAETVDSDTVHCRVLHGAILKEHKGINLPDTDISSPCITKKDRGDIKRAIDAGVDLLALSFVRSGQDVAAAARMAEEAGRSTPVIAKIETREALEDLDAILCESWGVMVARGDLAVETSTAEVPIVQKEIIREASVKCRPVITATQMLESMTENPRPTRAEASDVANAVFDGTDAVMLSGETAVGRFPVETVSTMSSIIEAAEAGRGADVMLAGQCLSIAGNAAGSCARGACTVAREVNAKAIVVFTLSGATALLVSQVRPAVPIVALTPNEDALRRLSAVWGVTPALIEFGQSTDSLRKTGIGKLIDAGFCSHGSTVVAIAGQMGKVGATNLIQVVTLP
jgi:pyruvate kinase